MATKKRTTPTTSDKPSKRRHTKASRHQPAHDDAVPAQAAEQTEQIPATAAPSGSKPTLESSMSVALRAAEAEPAALDHSPPQPAAKVKKLSALDAAAQVLGESGQAMSCAELIAVMAAKGYWSSPKGKTPASTLYAAVQRELTSKGEQARFRKTERGKFALRGSL